MKKGVAAIFLQLWRCLHRCRHLICLLHFFLRKKEKIAHVIVHDKMVGFEFHYIFYTNSGKETHFRLECPFMPFPLELSEHVFSPKAFHAFFTWTF